jgi:hypothetical protein
MNAVSAKLRDLKKRVAPTPIKFDADADERPLAVRIASFQARVFFGLPREDDPSRPVSPRRRAKAAGHVRYVSKRPCPRGHVGERFTSCGSCVECRAQRTPEQAEAHRTYMNSYMKTPAAREAARKRRRKYWAANREKARESQKKYRERKRARREVHPK